MQERFRFSPNSLIESAAGRRMLNPYLIIHFISLRMKVVISRVRAKACGPLEMAVSSAWIGHAGAVCVGLLSSS